MDVLAGQREEFLLRQDAETHQSGPEELVLLLGGGRLLHVRLGDPTLVAEQGGDAFGREGADGEADHGAGVDEQLPEGGRVAAKLQDAGRLSALHLGQDIAR